MRTIQSVKLDALLTVLVYTIGTYRKPAKSLRVSLQFTYSTLKKLQAV